MARKKSGANMPTPGSVQTPIEIDSEEDDAAAHAAAHKHNTRTAKKGRAADTYAKYDMKYHPADDTLRPARAAKRHAGRPFSRSISTSTITKEDEHDCETDEESLPSSAEDTASVQSLDNDSDFEGAAPERKPDPNATRASKRSEAKKYHNYSNKHHKDDEHIPGFEHKAGRLKRATSVHPNEETTPKRRRLGRLRKPQDSLVTPRTQHSVDVDDLVEETLLNLARIAPSTARVSMNPDEQVDSVSSDEEDNESRCHNESNDLRAEEDPLPLFTNLDDDTNAHYSQSAELPMPRSDQNESSDDIDTALLNFIQVQTSDQTSAANVVSSEEVTSGAQNSNDVIEAAQDVSDASHADSSHTLHGFVNSEDRGQYPATLATSPGSVSQTVENIVDEKSGTVTEPDATTMMYPTSSNTAGDVSETMRPMHGHDKAEDVSDGKTKAGSKDDEGTQHESAVINTQNETHSTGMSKTSASSKTLQGDHMAEFGDTTQGVGMLDRAEVQAFSSVERARPIQEPEHVSVYSDEQASEELVHAAGTTLQAMLESEIATSQRFVANSSSSDMLM